MMLALFEFKVYLKYINSMHYSIYSTQLKKNPTINIPVATIPMKVAIKGHFKTFFKMMISGNDNPMVDIINAKAVPSGTPFSINTLTMGMIPAALE